MLTAAQIVNAPTTLTTPAPSRWEQRVAWAARELGFDAPPPAAELQARFVERLSDEQFMPQGSASEAFCTLMADAEGIIEVDDPPPFAHAQHFSLLTRLEALQGELLSLPVGVRRERLARLKAECAHDPWPLARIELLERHLDVDVETTTRTDEPLRELIAGLIELTTLRPLPRAVRRRELVRSLQRHGNAAGLAQRLSKLRPDVAKLDPWLLVLLEKLPTEVPGEPQILMVSSDGLAGNNSAAMANLAMIKRVVHKKETTLQFIAKVLGITTLVLFLLGMAMTVLIVNLDKTGQTQDEWQAAQQRQAQDVLERSAQQMRESNEKLRAAQDGIQSDERDFAPVQESAAERQQRLSRTVEETSARMQELIRNAQERREEEQQQKSERDLLAPRPRGVDINPLDNGTQRILEDARRRMEESRQRSDQMMRDFEQLRKDREAKYELERKQRDEEFRQQQEETYKRLGIPPPPRLPY
jgi:hypothetical protein